MKELLPQRKVVAGGVSGAVCYLIIRVLSEGFGIQVQAEDAVALLTVISFAIQYAIPNKAPSAPAEEPT